MTFSPTSPNLIAHPTSMHFRRKGVGPVGPPAHHTRYQQDARPPPAQQQAPQWYNNIYKEPPLPPLFTPLSLSIFTSPPSSLFQIVLGTFPGVGGLKGKQLTTKKAWGALFQVFINSLWDRGLEWQQMTPDGDCFFHCLSNCLCVVGTVNAYICRQLVMNEIENNRDAYLPFIEDDVSFDEYVKKMRKPSSYAGEMEALAVTNMLPMGIQILVDPNDPAHRKSNFAEPQSGGFQMVLVYHGAHYDLATVRVRSLLYSSYNMQLSSIVYSIYIVYIYI